MSWPVQYVAGTVFELHQQSFDLLAGPGPASPVVRVLQPIDTAVVLGSTQGEAVADPVACAAAGAQIVRRRSGGGAVLVGPGSLIWLDLVVPADDPVWCADVGRAAWWAGDIWARALGAAGFAGADAWKGPMLKRPWSSLVCFAGLAGGEVTLARGRKVVGISQRRARAGVLLQCACLLRWEPLRLLELLAMESPERAAAAREVAEVAVGAGEAKATEVLGQVLDVLSATTS